MLRQAPSRTAPPAPPKHTGLCPMPAHTCLGQEWESSPLAPPACFLGLGDRGVPLPRKSPDLQRVSDALNAERAWTWQDALRQDRALILKEVTPRCPVAVSPPWAPGLAAVCGLQGQSEVRAGGWLQIHAGPGIRQWRQATPRCLHVQPQGPITSSLSWCELLAPLLGRLPGPGAPGIRGASLEPLLGPGGLGGPPAPLPPWSPQRPRPRSPLPPAARSSQADLQPRN